MNDKIVFFDIDGTLVNDEKQIPDSTKEGIQKLTENGVHVAIATGRGPFMFEPIRKELSIDSFVSFNGSYVVFKDEVIQKVPLSAEAIEKIELEAEKAGHPLVYLDHQQATSNADDHDIIKNCTFNLMPTYPAYHPAYYKENEVYQVLLFCQEQHEKVYRDGYKGTFDFIRWHEDALDILPTGGSKAKGIEAFMKKMNMKPENVYAFGDALNDIEMLKTVGTGIAMGNGLPEAKEAADYVTKSVDEDGIYHGLKHFGLI
ncbi:Cof-type HAD-IIB family hydrolase [Fictibacillus barbaricus]|uniref:Cof subfamily protein (Haloacid dehalogenase superfamily) n=1 Tax=Fictibacillus barbaricus TaxID=182136 RepID=A0ABU1TXD4_9BACL|nr:Cof-type HAD-IIB family hydrolase [Fictibacillus barbaricus]MDR7071862.1 Cof subfamily protein (haloacid dehalogenase superfamily) [Fictibacillus barbaricus]